MQPSETIKIVRGARFTSLNKRFKKQFSTKNHYITINPVRKILMPWEPKLKVSGRKENNELEKQASIRLKQLRTLWSWKFSSGCIGTDACQQRSALKSRIDMLK